MKSFIAEKTENLFDYETLIKNQPWIVEQGHYFVVSPDADGFYSSMLLTHFLKWKCVGFYDGRVLLLKDKINEDDIIYVDVEVFNPEKKSIGNHALLPGNVDKFKDDIYNNFKQSINPNLLRVISNKEFNHKYPFGTSHFLLSILAYHFKDDISFFLNTPEKMIAFSYADGMSKNMDKYTTNCLDWARYLRFGEEWNPFKVFNTISLTRFEKMQILDDFYGKINSLNIKNQRGDKLSITAKGKPEAYYKQSNGLYGIKEINKESVIGFLKMSFSIFNIEYDEQYFDCWNDLHATVHDKVVTKPGDKYFYDMLAKNPISYAVTGTNELSYTLK